MYNAISTEFLKLRRSKMLLFAIIAGILPSMVKYFQYAFGKDSDVINWEWFLASRQELMVFGILIAVVLISSFIFCMEYQYNTASYIFTARATKTDIFLAKLAAVLGMITFLCVVSAFSQLIFGLLALKEGLGWVLLMKYLKVTAWYIISYFLVSTVVIMIVVLLKRFVLSSVVALGYLIMVFPYHLKNNPYISPFMTPAVVASKILGSDDYFLAEGYYKDIAVNNTGLAVFLAVLAVISLAVGVFWYKRSDAVK